MKPIILFLSLSVFLIKLDINEVRQLYKQSVGSKENTYILFEKLKSITKNDSNVLVAYKGAATAMTGKYEKGVKEKTTVFKSGVSLVEYAIEQEPDNIEIRFVRLSIQQNSPKFLKYKVHLEEDKKFVLTNYKNIQSVELKNYLKDYILHSNNFTDEEKNVISHP